MDLKVVVIYGSTRNERQGIKAAKFIVRKLKERKHNVIFVDPLEWKVPLLKKRYSNYPKGKAPKNLEKLHKIFKNADAYVIVSAEYNHGIPPALKNIIDHFLKRYKRLIFMVKVQVDSTGERLSEGFYYDPHQRSLLYYLGPELENEFEGRNGNLRLGFSETLRLIPYDGGSVSAYIRTCEMEIEFARYRFKE